MGAHERGGARPSRHKGSGPGATAIAHRAKNVPHGKRTQCPNPIASLDAMNDQASSKGGRVLFEHRKRGGATVKVTIAEYNGSRFLDVREWVERDGQPLATRKGATMPLEALEGLGTALMAASRANDSSGLQDAS